MNAKEYVLQVEGDVTQIVERAFKAGVKEGRRRQQEHLVYLIKRDRWDETDLPIPEGHDDRLPGYHALLNYLCDQLHVAGAVTFWQAVENVKKRLEGAMTDFEVLMEMLTRAGVVFHESEDTRDPSKKGLAVLAGLGPKNEGYAGFGTSIGFNADGSLDSIGAWEG